MHNINKTHVCNNSGALAVARFDFSWGDAAYHQETLENLKLAIKSTKKLCAVSDETPLFICLHPAIGSSARIYL